MFENRCKILIFVVTCRQVLKPWLMIFSPLKILLNSWKLEESKRIFKGKKRIVQGFPEKLKKCFTRKNETFDIFQTLCHLVSDHQMHFFCKWEGFFKVSIRIRKNYCKLKKKLVPNFIFYAIVKSPRFFNAVKMGNTFHVTFSVRAF